MKKVLLIIFLGLVTVSCGASYTSYNDFINQTKSQGWHYHTKAKPLYLINQNREGEYWSAGSSQYEANQNAVQQCNSYFRTNDCVVYQEGYTNVYEQRQREKAEAEERQLISNIKDKAIAAGKLNVNVEKAAEQSPTHPHSSASGEHTRTDTDSFINRVNPSQPKGHEHFHTIF